MQHVPAWKRLGLKLKYAKDDPEPLGQAPAETGYSPQGSKRQATSHPEETTSKPSKKQKLSRENGQAPSEADPEDDKGHSPSQPKGKTVSVDRKASKGKHQTFDSEEYVRQFSFQCFFKFCSTSHEAWQSATRILACTEVFLQHSSV